MKTITVPTLNKNVEIDENRDDHLGFRLACKELGMVKGELQVELERMKKEADSALQDLDSGRVNELGPVQCERKIATLAAKLQAKQESTRFLGEVLGLM